MVPDEKINEFVEKIRAAAGREPRERDPVRVGGFERLSSSVFEREICSVYCGTVRMGGCGSWRRW